ncbi:hypothetical protein Tco_1123554 [Tanacetum coccineum]|uniref:Uncharacterized protein n=1 Tax=Tanacetum coccineum TaxID=301880 RepID=A0ABQ5J7H0_9ASTR
MSLLHISISPDSNAESVGSSASHEVLEAEATVVTAPTAILDHVLESDLETELSEALPSPDYVPASPDCFPGSEPESDPEEDP